MTAFKHDQGGTAGNRGIAPFILNFGSSWKWMVNLTPRLLYPQQKCRHQLARGLCVPHTSVLKRKISRLTGIRTLDIPADTSSHYTDRSSFLWRWKPHTFICFFFLFFSFFPWNSTVLTDLEHLYRIYSNPTHDKHQWLLLQFIVLLMMAAKGVRNI